MNKSKNGTISAFIAYYKKNKPVDFNKQNTIHSAPKQTRYHCYYNLFDCFERVPKNTNITTVCKVEILGNILGNEKEFDTDMIKIIKEVHFSDPISTGLDMPNYIVTENGTKKYYNLEGQLHREDGPAIERKLIDGIVTIKEYHINGQIHRIDGPAIIVYNNKQLVSEKWFTNGKQNRDGGPAVITYGDNKVLSEKYYKYGKLHCISGPAVKTFINGVISVKKWYDHGKLNRGKGPAVEVYSEGIYTSGTWYENGKIQKSPGL